MGLVYIDISGTGTTYYYIYIIFITVEPVYIDIAETSDKCWYKRIVNTSDQLINSREKKSGDIRMESYSHYVIVPKL